LTVANILVLSTVLVLVHNSFVWTRAPWLDCEKGLDHCTHTTYRHNATKLFTKQMNRNEYNNRQDLFSKKAKKPKSSTASEAQRIQKSLLKTQHLLKNELNRVSTITNAIEEDGDILQQTMDHHKSLNTKNAHQALTALQRAQAHEQRVLNASVFVFGIVVLHIVWSRVLIKFDFVSIVLDWIV